MDCFIRLFDFVNYGLLHARKRSSLGLIRFNSHPSRRYVNLLSELMISCCCGALASLPVIIPGLTLLSLLKQHLRVRVALHDNCDIPLLSSAVIQTRYSDPQTSIVPNERLF